MRLGAEWPFSDQYPSSYWEQDALLILYPVEKRLLKNRLNCGKSNTRTCFESSWVASSHLRGWDGNAHGWARGWDMSSNRGLLRKEGRGAEQFILYHRGASWRRQSLPRGTQDMIPLDVFTDRFLSLVLLWRICFLFSVLLIKTPPYLKADQFLWFPPWFFCDILCLSALFSFIFYSVWEGFMAP